MIVYERQRHTDMKFADVH